MIFKTVPEVILEGEVDIPYCLAEGRWLRIKQYINNICGLAIALEDTEDKFKALVPIPSVVVE